MARVLVATCGNCLAGDDAFGPRVGAFLREVPLEGIEVVDLDIKPAALLDHLPGPDCLVLVDAVRIEESLPGEVVTVDLQTGDFPVLLNDDAMSSHGLGLAHQLALARELDLLPGQVWLVGAALESFDPGSDPSAWMEEAVPQARARITEIVALTGSAEV